jgi:hypothetical protein
MNYLERPRIFFDADESGNWTNGLGITLQRGDIVAYYGTYGDPGSSDIKHSQILLDSTQTWAANNNSAGHFVVQALDYYSKNNSVRYIKIWRK